MPPLSLTHLKYAAAASEPSVKSMPGILVVIEPALIGVPVAFSPVPAPHFVSVGVVPPASLTLPPPPPPPPPPDVPDPTASNCPQREIPDGKFTFVSVGNGSACAIDLRRTNGS